MLCNILQPNSKNWAKFQVKERGLIQENDSITLATNWIGFYHKKSLNWSKYRIETILRANSGTDYPQAGIIFHAKPDQNGMGTDQHYG